MQSAQLSREHTAQRLVMQVAYARAVKISSPRHLRRQAKLKQLIDRLTSTGVADAVETPKSHISNLAKGERGIGDALAARLDALAVEHLGVPVGWIDRDEELDGGATVVTEVAPAPYPTGLAQSMSYPTYRLPPKRLQWRDMATAKTLPDEFQVDVPDDACAPDVRAGWLVQCSRGEQPRPGDHIVVRDANGVTFFRLYGEGPRGTWEALATGKGYRSLNSEADGLQLVAVVMYTMRPRGA